MGYFGCVLSDSVKAESTMCSQTVFAFGIWNQMENDGTGIMPWNSSKQWRKKATLKSGSEFEE